MCRVQRAKINLTMLRLLPNITGIRGYITSGDSWEGLKWDKEKRETKYNTSPKELALNIHEADGLAVTLESAAATIQHGWVLARLSGWHGSGFEWALGTLNTELSVSTVFEWRMFTALNMIRHTCNICIPHCVYSVIIETLNVRNIVRCSNGHIATWWSNHEPE